MKIFTCEDRFEAIMTCIYDAWAWALKNGHENVRLMKEPISQMTLFDTYEHVEKDSEKAGKVIRSIQKKISYDVYLSVYYAATYEKDVLDDIYRFLRLGFQAGPRVTQMLASPEVMKMMEIRRAVGNESHFWREFMRFDQIGPVLVAHFEPKSDVAYMVSQHFSDRMPSEDWMIVDDKRRLAVVHPMNQESYIRYLTEEEWERLHETEGGLDGDIYPQLWKSFFKAIAIKERENPTCQRNHMPMWMRKHMTENM